MSTITTTNPAEVITEMEVAAEVDFLTDAAILSAAREQKRTTVPAPTQRASTVRGWSFSGSVD